jgi:hypothetical protein
MARELKQTEKDGRTLAIAPYLHAARYSCQECRPSLPNLRRALGAGYSMLQNDRGNLDIVAGLKIWNASTEISFSGGIVSRQTVRFL